jgi:hypothetical protein
MADEVELTLNESGMEKLSWPTLLVGTVEVASKLYLPILRPDLTALLPEDDALPRPLRDALHQLDIEIRRLHKDALPAA